MAILNNWKLRIIFKRSLEFKFKTNINKQYKKKNSFTLFCLTDMQPVYDLFIAMT